MDNFGGEILFPNYAVYAHENQLRNILTGLHFRNSHISPQRVLFSSCEHGESCNSSCFLPFVSCQKVQHSNYDPPLAKKKKKNCTAYILLLCASCPDILLPGIIFSLYLYFLTFKKLSYPGV